MSSHRLKSISKINAKSSVNENITIDAKHNDMVKYFKDLQKSVPGLKNDLKNLVNCYKTMDNTGKSDFEILIEKNNLRDKINELKEKINSIVEREEENKYYLEVGVLLHNYYDIMENSKNNNNDDNSNDFEKNLLHSNNDNYDNENNCEVYDDDDDECSITSHDDENDVEVEKQLPPKPVIYKSVLNFFNERETTESSLKAEPKDENKKDNGYTSMKISDFVKEESVIKKKIILDEYLKKIDPNYVTKIKIDVNTCKCPTCKVEMVLYPSDGIQFCEKCGLQENILIESDKPSFKDPPMEVSYFSYTRINHYNEYIGYKRQKVTNELLQLRFYIKLCLNSILKFLQNLL